MRITSENVTNPPTVLALSVLTVAENQTVGAVVGTFSTTDDDTGDILTLISGTGDTDNASFTIDGDSLKTASSFDYENKSSYSIRVKTMTMVMEGCWRNISL